MSIQCGKRTQKFHTGAHKRVAKTDNRCLKQFGGVICMTKWTKSVSPYQMRRVIITQAQPTLT